jgi:hypothetical protein
MIFTRATKTNWHGNQIPQNRDQKEMAMQPKIPPNLPIDFGKPCAVERIACHFSDIKEAPQPRIPFPFSVPNHNLTLILTLQSPFPLYIYTSHRIPKMSGFWQCNNGQTPAYQGNSYAPDRTRCYNDVTMGGLGGSLSGGLKGHGICTIATKNPAFCAGPGLLLGATVGGVNGTRVSV